MPIQKSKQNLIVFAKEPKKGKVKTRLKKDCPQINIEKLYKAFVRDVLDVALKSDCDERMIYYTGGNLQSGFLGQFQRRFSFVRQVGSNLGKRMVLAFKRSLKDGFQKTIIIGTDCLTLNSKDIKLSFSKLSTYDCVIGPSRDGGYYLIGLKKPTDVLFNGIAWSGSQVLADTLKKARKYKYRVYLLKEKEDIDSKETLKRYARSRNRLKAKYTHKYLGKLDL